MIHILLPLTQCLLWWNRVLAEPTSNLYHMKSISPITWPSLFHERIHLNPNIQDSAAACGTLCNGSPIKCNAYMIQDGTCLLGSFPAPSSSVVGLQTQNEKLLVENGLLQNLTKPLEWLEEVAPKFMWLTSMVGYVDLVPGDIEEDCFIHCSSLRNDCAIVVVENGRCHYGVAQTITNSPDGSVLKSPHAPWKVYFTPSFSAWSRGEMPRFEIQGVSGPVWSDHVFHKTTTDHESKCAVFCYLHNQFWSSCTFYVYQSHSKTCFVGEINRQVRRFGIQTESASVFSFNDQQSGEFCSNRTMELRAKNYLYSKYLYKSSPNLEECCIRCHFDPEDRCSFSFIFGTDCFFGDVFQIESNISFPISDVNNLNIFFNREFLIVNSVAASQFVEIQSPLRVWGRRVFDPWGSFHTLEECATACMLGSSSKDGHKDWGCHFVRFDPTDGTCQMGNLDFNQHNSTLTSSNQSPIIVRKDVLARLAGQDFSQSAFNASWNKFIYESKDVDPLNGFHKCVALCALDFGPCSIMILDSTNSKCYLADWYVNSELYISLPSFNGLTLSSQPKMGVLMGGMDPNGNVIDDSEVLTEDSSVCLHSALPILPTKIYLQAVVFVTSINMLMFCGGTDTNTAYGNCYGMNLNADVPKWNALQNYPINAISFAMVEVNSNVYGIGGKAGTQHISTIYHFDIENDVWSIYDDTPEPLAFFGVVTFQDEVWIIGGSTIGGISDSTHVWNPSNKSWRLPGSISSTLPSTLKSFACGVIKDRQTGHDWILTIGGHKGVPPASQMVYYFDIQDNTEWKNLEAKGYQPQIHGSTDHLLPSGWNSFPVSSSSLIQFGTNKFTLASGFTVEHGESPENVAVWQEELGVFVWSSYSLTKGRKFVGLAEVPLHTRWTCLSMGSEWIRIVEQTSSNFFAPSQISGYSSPLYSNLDNLNNYKSACLGHYHFRLVWPGLGYFNEWLQENDMTQPSPVSGFKRIALKYPNHFGGLFYVNIGGLSSGHPDDTFAKGDTRLGGESYAVGRFSGTTGNLLPGPVEHDTFTNIDVDHLILYIKDDCN